LTEVSDVDWPPLVLTRDGIEISATCSITALATLTAPADWPACAALFAPCAELAQLSSKSLTDYSVGGALREASPTAAMISLTAGLDGVCTILTPDGGGRRIAVSDFVTGVGTTVLAPGELLRSVFLPAAALRSRARMRRGSLPRSERSAALLIGRLDPSSGALTLAITASTPRPVVLAFPELPTEDAIRDAVADRLPLGSYLDDRDGDGPWRETLTLTFAEQIRRELSG
jgi:CO/xanthine dehydrogenase FAD-binding subunit